MFRSYCPDFPEKPLRDKRSATFDLNLRLQYTQRWIAWLVNQIDTVTTMLSAQRVREVPEVHPPPHFDTIYGQGLTPTEAALG